MKIRLLFLLQSYAKLEKRFAKSPDAIDESEEVAILIRDAIRRAGRLGLWKKKCLVHTFVARKMLNDRKLSSRAFLGIQAKNDQLDFAHAWIHSSGIDVVPSNQAYQPAHEF